ncbi:hypothetical protein AYO44_10240 [Planctomycetaceae bacterium SCGC AG-212-F19]|nr:hypothetical protein AYO44_10240 [Planctomycetaceae bacterium SCGC AG-212-F19]
MPITFHCACGQTLVMGEDHGGQKARCPSCGQVLDVPVYALAFADGGNGTAPIAAIPVTPGSDGASSDAAPSQSGLWNQITGEPVAPSAPSGTPGRPYYTLYSPAAVAAAAGLGSVLAGAIVLTYNYQLLGKKAAAIRSLAGGVLGTAACFLLFLLISAWIAVPVVLFGSALIMFAVAQWVQEPLLREHRAKGGEEASVQSAAGLGLLCTGLFAIVWFVGYFPVSSQERHPSVTFGAHGVYYTEGITQKEASRLGELLVDMGLFDMGERYHGSKYVWLSRNGDAYVVSFLLKEGAWDRPEMVTATRAIRRKVADDLFPGHPVQIDLCDGFRNVQVSVKD